MEVKHTFFEQLIEVIGREKIYNAKAIAKKNSNKTTVEVYGKILGGNLTITVDFDERTDPEQRYLSEERLAIKEFG